MAVSVQLGRCRGIYDQPTGTLYVSLHHQIAFDIGISFNADTAGTNIYLPAEGKTEAEGVQNKKVEIPHSSQITDCGNLFRMRITKNATYM